MQHPTTQPINMKDERRRLHSILLVTVVCTALTAAAAGAGTGSDRPDFPISVADLEARHAQLFARLDSNSDGDITPEEFAAARASGNWQRRWQDGARRWRDHAIDQRWLLSLFGRSYYVVLLAGGERRTRARRLRDRILHPLLSFGNGLFAVVFFTALMISALVTLYLLKSFLGINLLPNMSLGVMPIILQELKMLFG